MNEIYINSLNNVFYVPNKINLKIGKTIVPSIKIIYDKFWEAIKTSTAISKNAEVIEKYNLKLKENDLTLLGLVTNGGQGLATANNGDFIGCIEGSNEANRVLVQRSKKLFSILRDHKKKIVKKFPELEKIDNLKRTEAYLFKIGEENVRKIFYSTKRPTL